MVNWEGPSPRDNFVGINCKSPRDLYTITLHTTKESTIERDDLADVFSAEHYMTCFLSAYAQFKSKKNKNMNEFMHSYTITYKSRLTQKKLYKKTDAIFSIYG